MPNNSDELAVYANSSLDEIDLVVGDLAQYSNSVLKSLRDHSEIKEVHSSFVLQTVKAPAALPLHYIKAR